MLQQEINFYQYFIKPATESDLFTWKRYWLANLGFLILLILMLFISIIDHFHLQRELSAENRKIDAYQVQFNKLKSTLPQFFFKENINETVSNLKAELETQKKIISILSLHNPFSQDLTAFSQSIVPNVWLTKFMIEKNGDDITLIGNSFGMNNLHQFIDHLKRNKIFIDYDITIKNVLNQDVKDPNTKLSFELNMVKNANG